MDSSGWGSKVIPLMTSIRATPTSAHPLSYYFSLSLFSLIITFSKMQQVLILFHISVLYLLHTFLGNS